jgi:hypothetical protein
MPVEILNWRTHKAKVVVRNWGNGTCVEFNLEKQLEDAQSLWVVQSRVTHELQWDPMKWTWQRQGKMGLEIFFNYTTKKGF